VVELVDEPDVLVSGVVVDVAVLTDSVPGSKFFAKPAVVVDVVVLEEDDGYLPAVVTVEDVVELADVTEVEPGTKLLKKPAVVVDVVVLEEDVGSLPPVVAVEVVVELVDVSGVLSTEVVDVVLATKSSIGKVRGPPASTPLSVTGTTMKAQSPSPEGS